MSLATLQYPPAEVAQKRAAVREAVLRDAPYVRQANFIKISDVDVRVLFRAYDQVFFQGELSKLTAEKSARSIEFKASGAMSSSGGRTTRYRQRMPNGSVATWFRIGLAGRILLSSFQEGDRAVQVSGQACADRLEAAMRIMEHEIVHLIEMLTFGTSSCAKTRFLTIAQRLFGHSHAKHGLVTLRERVAVKHQLRVGDQVEFTHHGRTLRGMLNRVGVKATVLVSDGRGRRYSDGGTYVKFYVAVGGLRAVRPTQSEKS
jgi:hypothetical protein